MFEDATDLIAANPPGFYAGVTVAELDRGRYSFVVAGSAGPNRVLAWSGGALRDVAPPELADPTRRAVGVTAGDLDGDGAEELYVLSGAPAGARGADRLFKHGPDGTWEDLFERPANRRVRNRAPGRNVVALDRRGVGRYGFFVAAHGRPMRLLELNPAGALTDLAPPLGLGCAAGGRGALALPVFSSHLDLFCTNDNGPNFAFRNRGCGTFDEVAAPLQLRDCHEHTRAVAAFDAGGAFGLAWVNADGPHRLMAPNGAQWKDYASPAFAFPSAARTIIAADFDNDGNDELFLNHLGESNRLYRVAPAGERSGAYTFDVTMLDPGAALDPGGYGTGAAVCDIDGDGVLELLVARGETAAQPLGVFKARAAYPNWLRVRPLTRFGAPARGAAVRAEYGGRVRVKGVCGGSGARCQMEPVAHFGLGDTTTVERVLVTWPDGAAVAVLNPGGNRVLTVPYPRG